MRIVIEELVASFFIKLMRGILRFVNAHIIQIVTPRQFLGHIEHGIYDVSFEGVRGQRRTFDNVDVNSPVVGRGFIKRARNQAA